MHKTIEEINLGLSTLAVTFSKDGSNPFKIVDNFLEGIPSIERIENPNAIEYKCNDEQFIIKMSEEDEIAILERYCLDNPFVNSFEAFLRLEDSKKMEDGLCIYRVMGYPVNQLKQKI
jgi:hypothetical protein